MTLFISLLHVVPTGMGQGWVQDLPNHSPGFHCCITKKTRLNSSSLCSLLYGFKRRVEQAPSAGWAEAVVKPRLYSWVSVIKKAFLCPDVNPCSARVPSSPGSLGTLKLLSAAEAVHRRKMAATGNIKSPFQGRS